MTVVMIGADEEARAIVERELAAAGIESFIEGSVVFGCQVDAADAPRAREILLASQPLKDHWVEFPGE